jgi:Cu-processing system permease protein
MIQRVGIAQALLNDPGGHLPRRADVRPRPAGPPGRPALILSLRDQGRTIFFSSHILSDAEALCSRVGIVARGRLTATGRLSDLLAFETRGWELVVGGRPPEAAARLGPAVTSRSRSRRGATPWSCRPRPGPSGWWRICGGGRAGDLAQPRSAPRSRSSSSVRSPRRRAGARAAFTEGERAPISESMRAVSSIAVHVFRESVRDRVPYTLLLFAVLLIAASYLLGQLTAGQDVKIIKDLGLAAISVVGLFIAIFIGIGLVSKEVERRSVYSLLTKPVSRPQFVAGKYAGLVLTLAVYVAVMTAALYLLLGWMTWLTPASVQSAWDAPGVDPAMLRAVFLIFVELALVTAIALFFSTFSTPMLSAALTLGLWIAGRFNAELRNFDAVVDSAAAAWLARGLYHALPDFSAFDVKLQVVHGLPVMGGYLALTAAYGAVYITALLLAATFIFARRDFK